jgi:hypothetical protein
VQITSEMIRAARALLRWDQAMLADKSKLSLPTIKRLEKHPGHPAGREDSVRSVQNALTGAGIEFIDRDGVGVKLYEQQ